MPLYVQTYSPIIDGLGQPYVNAEVRFYQAGTTTPAVVYTDAAFSVPHAQPIKADARGVLPPIYLSPSLGYRVITFAPDGTELNDIDNITGGQLVATDDINAGAVTTDKIAAAAVTNSKLAAQSVSNDKMLAMPAQTVKMNPATSSGTPSDVALYEMFASVFVGCPLQLGYTASDTAYWLVADGRAVSRTVYARLFAKIGTLYGAGDGSTTFNIPDWRNIYFRNTKRGRTGTYGAGGGGIGGFLLDAIKEHTHGVFYKDSTANEGAGSDAEFVANSGAQVQSAATGDVETRPMTGIVDCVIWY